jgi:hypothetical protein
MLPLRTSLVPLSPEVEPPDRKTLVLGMLLLGEVLIGILMELLLLFLPFPLPDLPSSAGRLNSSESPSVPVQVLDTLGT